MTMNAAYVVTCLALGFGLAAAALGGPRPQVPPTAAGVPATADNGGQRPSAMPEEIRLLHQLSDKLNEIDARLAQVDARERQIGERLDKLGEQLGATDRRIDGALTDVRRRLLATCVLVVRTRRDVIASRANGQGAAAIAAAQEAAQMVARLPDMCTSAGWQAVSGSPQFSYDVPFAMGGYRQR